MSYPPGPQDPYSTPPQQPQQPPYGYPQQGQPQQPPPYGYQQQPPQQPPYGYQQQGYPQAGAPYGYQQPPAGGPAVDGYVTLPYLGAVQIAGMGMRLLAKLLDWVVFSLVYAIAQMLGMAGTMSLSSRGLTDNASAGWAVFAVSLYSIFLFLYEWLMISFTGATLGKMALGLRVVRERDGQLPGLGSSFGRFIIQFLGWMFCGLPVVLVYLSPFFDGTGRQRGWHDRTAGTIVIKK